MAHPLPIPADFAANAPRPNVELVALYGVCIGTLAKWRKACGVKAARRGGNTSLEVPADLAERAAEMDIGAMAAHYGLHRSTVRRLLRDAGLKAVRIVRAGSNRLPIPADLPGLAKTLTLCGLARHYGVTHKTAARFCKEAGVVPSRRAAKAKRPAVAPVRVVRAAPKASVRRAAKLPAFKPVALAPHDGSRAARAAEFLRCRDPVFRCDAKGAQHPKGTHWFTCSRVLTGDELVARAEAKGWDANAWERIAA